MSAQWSTVASEDGRFVFAEAGSGPLVLLLHGFPDTPHGFERTATALADAGYRAVRPWLRGYYPETIVEGRPYDVVTIGSDPIAFLDALGEDEAILVGHDWGAAIVYGAATFHPERVRGIVPIAIPHPTLLPRGPSTLWAARHFLALKMPWAESAVRRGDFAYLDTLYRRWAPNWAGPARDRSLANVKAAFADSRALNGALDYYRAVSPRPAPEFKRPPAARGLVVGGTVDLIAASVFERTAELLGQGSEALIVDGAGHWPHREGEDAFLSRLIAFAGELDRPG
ncbi:MAG TPA: alpha/beta hydrolase [Solirubrobacterales bacterium]|jgi:pimeloyl-ACP methyl ester carboxylesterase